tara:strand:+ start:221 stop:643 length:423 start_codon:yes stop_codon:yes gene_type:complete
MESKDINPIERLHDDIRQEHDSDCTEDLMDCTIECDVNDKECHDDCIEEYHDCVIPGEHDITDVSLEEWSDIPMENVPSIEYDEGEIISEILTLTALLNGKCTRSDTLNSTGRSSKLITIEYDIKERDERSSQETTTDQT